MARQVPIPDFLDTTTGASSSAPVDYDVSFVLVYVSTSDRVKIRKRVAYERSLLETGFILSTITIHGYHFTKVHVPLTVLYQYGELLKMRMPLKLDRSLSQQTTQSGLMVNRFLSFLNVKTDDGMRYTLKADFKRDKIDLFDLDHEDFFNTSAKIFVVSYILDRAPYNQNKNKIGILGLISEGVYSTAYPLHEGNIKDDTSVRCDLLENWASLKNIFRYQPLDDIKNYFGQTVALYFAWQGFYIHMLFPLAAIGLFSFITAYFAMPADELLQEICKSNHTICPLCDHDCPFLKLNTRCTLSKYSYAGRNVTTVPISLVFIIWGELYICLWKRYRECLNYNWGLSNYHLSGEPSRPEYLQQTTKVKTTKLNIVTLQNEPHLQFWQKRFPIQVLSAVVLLFTIALYISSYIISKVIYMKILVLWSSLSWNIVSYVFYSMLFVLMYVLSTKSANALTNYERHRTQTEHEDSLYLKYFIFDFVICYTPTIYITFIKTYFIGYPGHYRRYFGYRPVECKLHGCEFETVMMTLTYLFLKEIMFFCSITVLPNMKFRRIRIANYSWWKKARTKEVVYDVKSQIVQDLMLLESKFVNVYYGYLHTTIEFGFITMFGMCFPLIPLFILCFNSLYLRLVAYMYLKYYRRPVPRRSRNIGIWITINNLILRLAVITNSFMIALSPMFMPHIIYTIHDKKDYKKKGLLKYMLSVFEVKDLEEGMQPVSGEIPQYCYYFDFRHPPDHKFKYERTSMYWFIVVGRLLFIVVYHVIVYAIINCLEILIPPTPSKISDKIQMENYHINKAILKKSRGRSTM